MELQKAIGNCHVRSAIYRESKPEKKYFKNNPIDIIDRIPEIDKKADDWKEWDPRDYDNCSLAFD